MKPLLTNKMSSGVIDMFIGTRNDASNEEKKITDEAKPIRLERDAEKANLIQQMKDNNVNVIEIPPSPDDPSGKPCYIRLEEHTKPGTLTLSSVEAAFFGPKTDDSVNATFTESDLTTAMSHAYGEVTQSWKERLHAATKSLAEKRAEEKLKQEKKQTEKSKRLQKRRKIISEIMKMKEEEETSVRHHVSTTDKISEDKKDDVTNTTIRHKIDTPARTRPNKKLKK